MRRNRPAKTQPRTDEIQDAILGFVARQFYPGRHVEFAKDRPRLLQWVVWKLAVYLDERAVKIPSSRYIEIMLTGKAAILMEALKFGDTGNITYLPAWLGRCVESHLSIHGEAYYEEGKALRDNIGNHIGEALKIAQAGIRGRDPVREMADAARLLKTQKRVKKQAVKQPFNDQLTMF